MANDDKLPRVPQKTPLYFDESDFECLPESSFQSDLDNDDLFPFERIRFAQNRFKFYHVFKPAFMLASQFIFAKPQAFSMFISRKEPSDGLITDEDVLFTSSDDIITTIKTVIPYVDIGEGKDEMAVTYLDGDNGVDVVTIDSKLITLAFHSRTAPDIKFVSFFMIACLLCHQIAHMLEYRIIRRQQLTPSGEQLCLTPPGITCTEAGIA